MTESSQRLHFLHAKKVRDMAPTRAIQARGRDEDESRDGKGSKIKRTRAKVGMNVMR